MCKKLILTFYDKSNALVEEKMASYPYNEDANIEQIFDLTYSDGKKSHLFDIYRLINRDGLQPAIIDIHGGGWYSCYKEMNKHFCMDLAKEGFTVFSINYTLCPETDMKGQIKDIFTFFNWLEASAQRFNVDLNNLFICGDSAGGQLAALSTEILSDNRRMDFFGVKSSLKFKGACFIGGAFDVKKIAKLPITDIYFKHLLGYGYRRKKILDEVDFFYATPIEFPKTLLITSKEDFMKSNSIKASEHLKSLGVDCELFVWEKSQVPKRKLQHVFNVLFPTWEESIVTNKMITDFFRKEYLKSLE